MVRDRPLQSVAGLLLAGVIALRLWDGSFHSLVQSWYGPILAASVVVLAAVSVTMLVAGLRSNERWEPARTPVALVSALLVLAPLVVAFAFQPQPLGSSSLQDDNAPRAFSQSMGSAPPTQRNLYQWAYEFAQSNPAGLLGQPVDVVGFVYHPKEAPADQFAVARFVVACCVADATGYKLPVRWAAQVALKTDAWIHVRGAVRAGPDGALFVDASAVDPIDAPANPYIYP
jgi:uncharacterized repeat protein (TIGR03943 family)